MDKTRAAKLEREILDMVISRAKLVKQGSGIYHGDLLLLVRQLQESRSALPSEEAMYARYNVARYEERDNDYAHCARIWLDCLGAVDAEFNRRANGESEGLLQDVPGEWRRELRERLK